MRKTRVYIHKSLILNEPVKLDREATHHLLNVLKIRNGQIIHAFDGSGGYYESELIVENKKSLVILPEKFVKDDRESPLKITLVQALAKGQKMDLIIQKSVEIGVYRIVPLITEFSNVKLDQDRIENRLQHWRKIIVSACEQCGRNVLPEISPPIELDEWIKLDENSTKLILIPVQGRSIDELNNKNGDVTLICGPEGGLSDSEVDICIQAGYQALTLGPRVLRTETAAVAGLVICQSNWGDMH